MHAYVCDRNSWSVSLRKDERQGSNLRHLREKENQMQIYKQVRRSLMMGERKRVRELRSRRSEEEERERAEDAIRREGDMSRERQAAEDELLERHRQIMQQAGDTCAARTSLHARVEAVKQCRSSVHRRDKRGSRRVSSPFHHARVKPVPATENEMQNDEF